MLTAAGSVVAVVLLFAFFNKGTIFFADEDPDYLRVYISARGNLSANEKRDIVMNVSRIAQTVDGIRAVYATSGGQSNSLNSRDADQVDNIPAISVRRRRTIASAARAR